jgi:hypothetical protein
MKKTAIKKANLLLSSSSDANTSSAAASEKSLAQGHQSKNLWWVPDDAHVRMGCFSI